jgi:hypothetical protein
MNLPAIRADRNQGKLFQADLSTSIILSAHQVRMPKHYGLRVRTSSTVFQAFGPRDFTFPGGSRVRLPAGNSTKQSDFVILAFSFDGL